MLLVGCDKGRQPGKLPEGQVQAAQQHRIRMLLKRLESKDEEERAVAVCALSKIGPDAVRALREGADHENELVRKGAHDVLRNKQLIVRVRFDAEVLRLPNDADGLIEMARRHRTDDKVQTTVFLLGDHENKTRDLLRRVAEAGGGEFSVTKRKDPRSTTRSTTSPASKPDRIDRSR